MVREADDVDVYGLRAHIGNHMCGRGGIVTVPYIHVYICPSSTTHTELANGVQEK